MPAVPWRKRRAPEGLRNTSRRGLWQQARSTFRRRTLATPRASRATTRASCRARIGGAASTRAGAWPAPIATTSTRPSRQVLNKATQAEVCFTCHKAQRAQVRRISAHPLAVTGIGSPAKMVCSDCHNPHGSTGPTLARQELGERDLLHLPCGEARVPSSGSTAPSVDNCVNCHTPHGSTNAVTAEDARAVAVPGVSQRRPRQPGQQRRQPGDRQGDDRQRTPAARRGRDARATCRARLPELPRPGPRIEPSGRFEVPALTTFNRGRTNDYECERMSPPGPQWPRRAVVLIAMALAASTNRAAAQTAADSDEADEHGGDRRQRRDERIVQGRANTTACRRRAASSSATSTSAAAAPTTATARCAFASRATTSAWIHAA